MGSVESKKKLESKNNRTITPPLYKHSQTHSSKNNMKTELLATPFSFEKVNVISKNWLVKGNTFKLREIRESIIKLSTFANKFIDTEVYFSDY